VSAGDRIGIASRSATLMAAGDAMRSPAPARAEEVTQLAGGVGNTAVASVMAGWNRLVPAVVGIGALEPSALLEQSGNAIRGALRGGWINVLITDTASARRLAEETA
jgi:DNA-binding transcriptional regulator LsrR (DeoR family)